MATQLVPLTQFYDLVRPHVPDCPITVIGQNLRLSAIEFAEETKAWRQMKKITTTKQGQALVAPSFTSIIEIEYALFNGEPLQPIQYTDVDGLGLVKEDLGQPMYITQTNPDTICVLPFAEGELEVSLFLRPRHETEYDIDDEGVPVNVYDQVPAYFLTQYGEAVAAGALYRLFILPKAPWKDPKLAAFYLARFQEKADKHFTSTVKGQQNAVSRVVPHFM